MKKGDKVKIKDGSYMMTINGNQLSHVGSYKSTEVIGWCKDTFTIIAVGGKYPTGDRAKRANDIMMVNDTNREIWFCSYINIKKPVREHTMQELYDILGYRFELIN
jgi:hypothetical protein